jgi:hypothetical protein
MDSPGAHEKMSSRWLLKDAAIYHPQFWPESTGASLQDVRTFYMKDKDTFSGSEYSKIDTSVIRAPWYITEPYDLLLCEVCRHINFEWLLRNTATVLNGPIVLLRDMLATQSSCSFCSLAITALCTADGDTLEVEDLDEGDNIVLCCISSDVLTQASSSPAILSIWRRILGVTGGFRGQVGHIQEVGSSQDGCLGRRISSATDLQLIRTWLKLCEEVHKNNAEQGRLADPESKRSDLQLRLLDVQNKCVVNAKYGTRYVALSYVWGRVTQVKLLMSNLENLSTKGALSHDQLDTQLPRTIADAMKLVENIGERYLWVGGWYYQTVNKNTC